MIFFLQELVTCHEISNVCCVLRDPANPSIFGYVTTTETGQSKNVAHVITTDSDVSLFKKSQLIPSKLGGRQLTLLQAKPCRQQLTLNQAKPCRQQLTLSQLQAKVRLNEYKEAVVQSVLSPSDNS